MQRSWRGRARIEEREFQEPVLGLGLAERDAHGAPGAFAVERDRRDAAVVDQDFEAAARLVGAHVVDDEHQLAGGDVGALRQRHEQLAAAAEIGEAKAVAEADVAERDRGQDGARPRLARLGRPATAGGCGV